MLIGNINQMELILLHNWIKGLVLVVLRKHLWAGAWDGGGEKCNLGLGKAARFSEPAGIFENP